MWAVLVYLYMLTFLFLSVFASIRRRRDVASAPSPAQLSVNLESPRIYPEEVFSNFNIEVFGKLASF